MNSQLGISIHDVGTQYVLQNNFTTVQLSHKFSDAGDITSLLQLNRKHPIKVSYHSPVFHQTDPRLTYYLSSNFRLREATFEILEINLRMAKSLPTEHVVVHLASSVVDEENTDADLKHQAKRSAKRIDMLSQEYNMPINIEYTSYNSRFVLPDDFIATIKDHSNLGLCIDLGHLQMVCKDYNLDYFTELKKMLPYTNVIYAWNTRSRQDVEKYGYIPVHPSQKTQDGWIDIEQTINLALSYNPNVKIIFEPNFKYHTQEYFEQGVNWINDMVNNFKGEFECTL